MEDVKARFKVIEDRLKARGVVDVKFYLDLSNVKPLSVVLGEAEEILNAVLDGRHKPAAPLGDSQRTVPKMLSPMTRCHGEHQGESHERDETSGTQASS